jgi:predicted Zn finger-like uncharacterized protein
VRLVCKSCGSRFTISDDLIRGKVVRFRCRQCSTIITAQLPTVEAPEHLREREPPQPPPPPSREWFLGVEGRAVGPLTLIELRQRVRRRELGPDDLIWREGLGMWQPVVAVEEVRDALQSSPEISQVVPPPLPPRSSSGSLPMLRLLSGGQAAALAPAPVAQARAEPSAVVLLAPAPQPRLARWPYWAAIASGVVMLLTTSVLLLRDRPRSRTSDGRAVGQRLRETPPAEDLPDEPDVRQHGPRVIGELPPIEVRRPRPPVARPRPAEVPDRLPTDAGPVGLARQLRTGPGDVKTVLALKVFHRNRSTLLACDRLAERRGETLKPGSRAEFRVRVEPGGIAIVEVRGQGMSTETLSCYRAVASRWQFPRADAAYSTSFHHVH